MAQIPIRPRLNDYRGTKPELQRKAANQNAVAWAIANCINRRMAVNPAEVQQYLFAEVGWEVGATAAEVRAAIGDGGSNGITVGVRGDARRALDEYLPKVGDAIRIRPTIAGSTEIDRIKGSITAISEDRAKVSFEGLNELGGQVWGEADVSELRYRDEAWLLERTVSVRIATG